MLNERLKTLRERHELSQKELAIAINKTPQAYNYYEKGSREPDIETLIKIADLFSISIDYLVGHTVHTAVSSMNFSEDEIELIKKYRALDEHGKETVDYNIEHEYGRSRKVEGNNTYSEAITG